MSTENQLTNITLGRKLMLVASFCQTSSSQSSSCIVLTK